MKRSWDRVAGLYDIMAGGVFFGAIRRSQTDLLPALPKGGQILIIGGGTGWILPEVFKTLEPKQVFYIDISPKMIAKAKRKMQKQRPEDMKKVVFITGELTDLFADAKVDLILTNFFLDVLLPSDFEAITKNLYRILNPGGYWHVADFQYPDKGLFRWYSKLLIPFMYFFFHILAGISARTLPDLETNLNLLEMNLEHKKLFYGKLIKTLIYRKKSG